MGLNQYFMIIMHSISPTLIHYSSANANIRKRSQNRMLAKDQRFLYLVPIATKVS